MVLSASLKSFTKKNEPVVVMQNNKLIDANQLAADFFGVKTATDLLFMHPSELSPEYQPDGENSFVKSEILIKETYRNKKHVFHWAHRNLLNDTLIWVKVSLQSFTHNKQKFIIASLSEQTEFNYLNDNIDNYSQNFLLLNEHKRAIDASSIVSKTDVKGRITYINENFCKISGFTSRELLGNNHNIVRHPSVPNEFFSDLWKTLKQGKVWRGVIKNMKKTGDTYYVDSTITPIKDAAGKIKEYLAIRNDVTDFINQKELIEQQSLDFQTKLPNRLALIRDLKKTSITYLAIVEVNELIELQLVHSQHEYQQLLNIIRHKLDQSLSKSEKLYRIGDNQFAIVTSEDDSNFFNKLANDLVKSFEENHTALNDEHLYLSLIIGICPYSADCLTNAGVALSYAKRERENIVTFNQSSGLQKEIKRKQLWAHKIKTSLSKGEVTIFGQQIVDKNKDLVSTEVLMRLKDNSNYISPYCFLDVAKETKLYPRLSLEVISKAFNHFSKNDLNFSLNITQTDIDNKKVMTFLYEKIVRYNVGNRLTIELVESEKLNLQSERLLKAVNNLKKLGCKIAIDDFGSGYSNFSYLPNLPIDSLKIDGSLIKNIDKNMCIIKAICDFCHELKVMVVAEFVDSEKSFKQLTTLGVDLFQGYYFHKPEKLTNPLNK